MEQKTHPIVRCIIAFLLWIITFKLLDTNKEVVVVDELVYTGEVVVYTGEEIVSTGVDATGAVLEELVEEEKKCVVTGVNITAKFTPDFIKYYEYEHNPNYKFALKVNGWYYNVTREIDGGVGNMNILEEWQDLEGAAPATALVDGYTWYIPYDQPVFVANPNGMVGYQVKFFTGIDTYELSPVKEGVTTSELTLENVFDCE